LRALNASEIIRIWETAYRFHPVDQALTILQQAMPEYTRDQLAALPLGRRDTLLLAVRRRNFGDTMPGRCHCRQCGEVLEFELSCGALTEGAAEPQQKVICRDEYKITLRPLDSFDLAAAAGAATVEKARELLLHRCVVESCHRGKVVDANQLPPAVVDSVVETAPATDPQAEVQLDLNCPACGHRWPILFDISRFLWQEISARARQLLMTVHQLARAYGWNELDILNPSPARRAAYLQMVSV